MEQVYSHIRTGEFRAAWRQLMNSVFDPYCPERYYMRGPGPKWREKHQSGSDAI